MKSKTSFFNGSVLKKDITRFLPVWALYTVFLLMYMVLSMSHGSAAYNANTLIRFMIHPMASGNLVYAAVCTLSLFGDLYVPKMCNALHAMPMRREGWFLTHALSGLLFSLVPNLLAALVCIPLLGHYASLGFLWLGAVTLQFLFFFGLALFSTLCAGSRIGMLAVYGIFNFFSMFLYGIITTLYVPLLYGLVISSDPFVTFCPVIRMGNQPYLEAELDKQSSSLLIHGYTASSWIYLVALAAIGLVFGLLALLLYRRRHLERAGDLLAVKPLSPVFLVIITLFSGMAFYFLSLVFFSKGTYVFLFIGMVVGFFVARMLTERTVRVFNKKSLLGFLLIAVLTAGSLFVAHMDPMGLVSKMPDADDVAVCTFRAGLGRIDQVTLEDPDQIQKVLEFHAALHQDPHPNPTNLHYGPDGSDFPVEITYTMKNGSQLSRRYISNTGTDLGMEIGTFLSSWRNVLKTKDLKELSPRIQSVSLTLVDSDIWDHTIRNEDFMPLLSAIKADCDAGNMALGGSFQTSTEREEAILVLNLKPGDPKDPEEADRLELSISTACTNTLDAIQDLLLKHPYSS